MTVLPSSGRRRRAWLRAAILAAALPLSALAALAATAAASGAPGPAPHGTAPDTTHDTTHDTTPDTTGCAVLWQVRPVLHGAEGRPPHLQLMLRFDAGQRAGSALHLPGGWDGLAELDAQGQPAATLQALPGEPAWRKLAHPDGGPVQLRWWLLPPKDAAAGGHTQLAADWFAFSGRGVLPVPEGLDEASADAACILLHGLGAGSRWASSHGSGEGSAALFRLGRSAVPLAQRVQQALYAGGALQWQAAPGVLAVQPAQAPWSLPARMLAEAGSRALAAQQRHWVPGAGPGALEAGTPAPTAAAGLHGRPDSQPPWLLLALPLADAGQGRPVPADAPLAGAWQHALALQLPTGWAGTAADAERLATRALARAWVAERFGPLAHAGRGDAALRAWFSDGWADYLAHRSLLREGLWTAEDYAAALNQRIAAYLAAPAHTLPNAELAALAGVAPALQAARGEWLALRWQAALRGAGQPGLDALLRRQLVPAWQARREGPLSAPLATHRLLAALRGVLQDQPLRDLQQYIDAGRPLPWAPDSLGPCFTGGVPADAGGPPRFRPVPDALQQADCQGWLGLGPRAEGSGTAARSAGPGAAVAARPGPATKAQAKAGKAIKASKGAKASKASKATQASGKAATPRGKASAKPSARKPGRTQSP